jgi:hypothetical protein
MLEMASFFYKDIEAGRENFGETPGEMRPREGAAYNDNILCL